jgi:hypothetical protein
LHSQIAQVQADIRKAKEDLEAVATMGRARLEEVQTGGRTENDA